MSDPSPIVTEHDQEAASKQGSRYRPAIVVSVIVHVGLALVLLFWYLPSRRPANDQPQPASADLTAGDQSGLRKPPPPQPLGDVPAEQIEKSLESQIDQVKQLPDERKLTELEKNLKRLESVASQESVRDVSGKIASTLGLDTEQYQPKSTPDAGTFDASTAQLQDVIRKRTKTGAWQYESILIDAGGRTMQVPMTAAEGETVYNTFQQMKKFPLAQGIYRSVVMPLIQKMLHAEEVASKAAVVAEQLQQQDQTTQREYQLGE